MSVYKNLGAHVSLQSVNDVKKYTNVFQICLSNPKQFISNVATLESEASKWTKILQSSLIVCHGPYNTNIICNNKNLTSSLVSITQIVKTCIKNKIKFLVIHPGVLPCFNKKTESCAILYSKLFIEKFLLGFKGVQILFENMSSLRSLGLDSLYEIVKDYANIGLCIDLNHSFGRGEEWEKVVKYIKNDKTKVIHLNAVPRGLKFGSGLDNHSKTTLTQSVGIHPEELKRIVYDFPDKIKIMEQYPCYSIKSFKFLM